MIPTTQQIEQAAYFRWLNRGSAHGYHDCDWREAEAALDFALNYEILVFEGWSVGGIGGRRAEPLNRSGRRVCRFCEHAEPRTTFGAPVRVLPEALRLPGLVTSSLCEECHGVFQGGIDTAFGRFLGEADRGTTRVTLDAYKGLAKALLAVLPSDVLDWCEQSVEWVAHEGEEFEPDLGHGPLPLLHWMVGGAQSPWFAVALKREEEVERPALVGFFGMPRFTLAATLPFCTKDDDWDGVGLEIPNVPILDGLLRGPGPVEMRRLMIGMPARSRRWAVLGE